MAETSNETASGRKRVRGAYYGGNIERELALRKVSQLQVEFDTQTGQAIKTYGKWFSNAMARYIRETFPPTALAWDQVTPADREIIRERLSVSIFVVFKEITIYYNFSIKNWQIF